MKEKLSIIVVMILSALSLVQCSGKEATKENHSTHNLVRDDMAGMDMINLTKRDEQYANIKIDTVKEKLIAEYTRNNKLS
jgi:hypothetical protein